MTRSVVLSLAVAVVVVPLIGCGETNEFQLYPVSGRVLVKGKPAVGAEVAFYGVDDRLMSPEAPFPRGIVQEDGSFELSCFESGDGAPAGNYNVTVVWKYGDSDDPEVRDQMPDRFRGRYSDPDKSGISVDVRPEPNMLDDMELK